MDSSSYTLPGLVNLIAKTEDEYVSKALDLASDISSLANTRMALRERMSKSRLCDGKAAVRDLEAVYRRLWHRYCDGDMPSMSISRRLNEKSS
jgi:predicted O-linked N-acetylglucosamine transferase (SPINDLY family)